MDRIVFSLGLVFFGLALGYIIQRLESGQRIVLLRPIAEIRKGLQKTALLVLNPVAILGATWVAGLTSVKIAVMPLLGITALAWGGVLAFGAARAFRFENCQTGAYIVCGGFTNIGSLGALFCFLLLGEQGFALVPFYKLFEEVAYYTVGFPLAKSFSRDVTAMDTFGRRIRKVVSDPFVLAAVAGMGIGFALNLSGLERPVFYGLLNSILIPTASLLLLISIGMAMRFDRVLPHLRAAAVIAAIKFIFVPATLTGLAFLAGLHHLDQGLPFQVVLILSSMPVGFIAMVPPTLYDLDIDLANACWLLSNLLLVLSVPLLMFILTLIPL